MNFLKRRWLFAIHILITAITVAAVMGVIFTTFKTKSKDEYSWVGGVQHSSANFRIRLPTDSVRTFVVSTDSELENLEARVFSKDFIAPGDGVPVESVMLDELKPETRYYYGHLDEDSKTTWSGTFSTPPTVDTKFNFSIAFAGCALTGSNDYIYDHIRELNPFMMLHAGDFHYLDPGTSPIDERVDGYGRVFEAPRAAGLFSSLPVAYMWDDHDYCGNNRGGDCEGRTEARKAYQVGVPHYPLIAKNSSDPPIPDADGLFDISPYQAFTIGTVRFILTDLRSESFKGDVAEDSVIMSPEQKEWFSQELEEAENYDFVVWLSTVPWIGEVDPSADSWPGYEVDRAYFSELIGEKIGKRRQNLLVVSSDSHMVAYDSGLNTRYASNFSDFAGFPILQSGPIHNVGSAKGGPYSDDCHTYTVGMNNQFSIIDFSVSETGACVNIKAFRSEKRGLDLILEKNLCGDLFFDPKDPANADLPPSQCNPSAMVPAAYALIITSAILIGVPFFVAIAIPRASNSFVITSGIQTLAVVGLLIALSVLIPFSLYTKYHFYTIDPVGGLSGATAIAFTYAVFLSFYSYKQIKSSKNKPIGDNDVKEEKYGFRFPSLTKEPKKDIS